MDDLALKVQGSFKLRRYWLSFDTPRDVLEGLNWRMGTYRPNDYSVGGRNPYVDVNYYGDSDRDLTLMELRYAEYIVDREELVYTVDCDDGLGQEDEVV